MITDTGKSEVGKLMSDQAISTRQCRGNVHIAHVDGMNATRNK